jgi:hypothetical protein
MSRLPAGPEKYVRELMEVMAPGDGSREGGRLDLLQVPTAEEALGVRFPSDYLAFIEVYGEGEVGDDIAVCSPKSVVGTTRVFREDPGPYLMHAPDGWSPDSLIRWGADDGANDFFWYVTGDDGDRWPVVEFEHGGPAVVHDCGMVEFLRRRCLEAGGPVTFLNGREAERLWDAGIDPRTGEPHEYGPTLGGPGPWGL